MGLTARRLRGCLCCLGRHEAPSQPGLACPSICRRTRVCLNFAWVSSCSGDLEEPGSLAVCLRWGGGGMGQGLPRRWYLAGTLGVPKRVATNMSINMEAEMLWEPDQSEVLIFLLCFSTPSSVLLSEAPPRGNCIYLGREKTAGYWSPFIERMCSRGVCQLY